MNIVPQWAIGWAIGVGIAIIAISAARTLSRLLRGGSSSRRLSTSDEALELRQAIDAMQNKLVEVEERLDFAERTLANYREADRLGHQSG